MKLERITLSQTARPIEVLRYWKDDNQMVLDAPYQRGDVWGKIRRRNLIRSILLGIPIPSIIINDRTYAGWGGKHYTSCAVIDGKQRITAILMFLEDKLDVPGEWFGIDQEFVTFSQLPIAKQRGLKNTPIQFCEGRLPNLEAEQELFELINFGGVPQGQNDTE